MEKQREVNSVLLDPHKMPGARREVRATPENSGAGAFGFQLSHQQGGSPLSFALVFIGTSYLGGNGIPFWKKSIFAA